MVIDALPVNEEEGGHEAMHTREEGQPKIGLAPKYLNAAALVFVVILENCVSNSVSE